MILLPLMPVLRLVRLNLMTNEIRIPFSYTFLLLSLPLSAQVPAGEDPEQSPPVSSLSSAESSPDLSLGFYLTQLSFL